ncbi:ribosomal RNA-processing protein 7-domain-containing protein [Hypoxylon rubiginosum]|uniref:Ribosomal RNA-processing protein 7-domain-containing protein n=1 Tax=Hypoxylon rubiginosum TaxID=110542 RepID=A0ACC0CPV7_9PEZI|nr:ribosomal RNA-processing protein 7-domain-containing protein [Hypoxylon rubiginosum]
MSQLPASEEFVALPISIPSLPSYRVQATHYLYLRRNAPRIPTADDSRSLYIANVPCDSTEPHFRALFSSLIGAGRFEGITFEQNKKTPKASHEPAQATRLAGHRKRKRDEDETKIAKDEAAAELPSTWTRQVYESGSCAVALFADEKSAEHALKAARKLKKPKNYPVWGEGVKDKVSALGSHWLKAHNKLSYPGNDIVQATMDAYFIVFNRKEKEAAQLAMRLRNEPDEDGFVTVTRGGRAAPARRNEAEEAKQKMLEREKKKKDEMADFYRFQQREKRKAEQTEMLKRFEEDKQKVRAMKEKRGKFRPET